MNQEEYKNLLRYLSDMVDGRRGIITLTLTNEQAKFIKRLVEVAGEL